MTQDAGSQDTSSQDTGGRESGGGTVPPGTNTEQVAPNPAGIPQPDPPEGGAAADPDSPDPADLAPGFGGDSESRPEGTVEGDLGDAS